MTGEARVLANSLRNERERKQRTENDVGHGASDCHSEDGHHELAERLRRKEQVRACSCEAQRVCITIQIAPGRRVSATVLFELVCEPPTIEKEVSTTH